MLSLPWRRLQICSKDLGVCRLAPLDLVVALGVAASDVAMSHPHTVEVAGEVDSELGAMVGFDPLDRHRRQPALLVVRIPGDPEEATGVGDRAELLSLPEPVRLSRGALFPDNVCHG